MTIIQPNKNKNKINLAISLLLLAIIVLIGQGIYTYSQSVTFRYDINSLEKNLREVEAQNAEIKNKIFTFFEPENIKRIVEEKGLIEEENPKYIKNSNLDNLLVAR